MAEVRQLIRRASCNFAHKTHNGYLLKSQKQQSKTIKQPSSLSPGFLFGNIENGQVFVTENAAETVTVGVSPDSYTRSEPMFSNVDRVCDKRNYIEYHSDVGLNDCSLSNKARVHNTAQSFSRYRSNVMFKGTFRTSRRVSWRHGDLVFVRSYSGASSEPLYKTKTGYYEILKVSPTATQVQIKTAYYKQSFIYHPDRNAGSDEATVRFSEISEAYTVLGNKALRKKYDRGLLSQSDLTATARPSSTRDTSGSFAKQQTGSRQSVMGAKDRGGVFDFDKFYKDHYGEQLQRQRDIKIRKEEMLKRKQESSAEKKLDKVSEMGVWVMLALAVVLLVNLKRD